MEQGPGRRLHSKVCGGAESPAVSVIIPAFNAERYLPSALESVLTQSWGDYEIVIVNDGSTDGTGDVIEIFMHKDPRIRRIDQANSGKPAIARNRGIQASRGQFLAFLDADDVWLPKKLEYTIEILQESGCALCYHDYYWMSGDGTFSPKSRWEELRFLETVSSCVVPFKHGSYVSKECFFGLTAHGTPAIQTSAVTLTRSALNLEKTWFPEDLKVGEDLDLWFRILRKNNIVLIAEPLCGYRRHETNTTADADVVLEGMIEVRERILRREPHLQRNLRKLIRKRLSDLYRQAAYLSRLRHDYKTAQRLYWRSLRYHPSITRLASYVRALLPYR